MPPPEEVQRARAPARGPLPSSGAHFHDQRVERRQPAGLAGRKGRRLSTGSSTPPGLPAVPRRELIRRMTNWEVHRATQQLPLSVSTDRIAYPTMKIAALLPLPRDRTRESVVVEVYPAAALHRWSLPRQRYKRARLGKGGGVGGGVVCLGRADRAPHLVRRDRRMGRPWFTGHAAPACCGDARGGAEEYVVYRPTTRADSSGGLTRDKPAGRKGRASRWSLTPAASSLGSWWA